MERENVIRKTAIKHFEKNSIPRNANFYIFDKKLPEGLKFTIGIKEYTLKQDSTMGFIDKAPGANWAHPCEYLLFDDEGLMAQTIDARMPPKGLPGGLKPFVHHDLFPIIPGAKYKTEDAMGGQFLRDHITRSDDSDSGERYALLFSGMTCHRHLNDLEFLYRTLVNIYGFKPENVSVLSYKGDLTHWSSNGSSDYDLGKFPNGDPQKNGDPWPADKSAFELADRLVGPGTKEALQKELTNISNKISSEDMLFIHTNSHGDLKITYGDDGSIIDKTSYLYTKDGNGQQMSNDDEYNIYVADEFGEDLADMNKFDTLLVMMEQCFSGGFARPVLDNSTATSKTCFISSVDGDHYSMGTVNTFWDYFARDWTAAMSGHCPYGVNVNADTDGNYRISAYEAYDLGKQRAYIGDPTDPESGDCPQLFDKPTGCGHDIYLGPLSLTRVADLKGDIRSVWRIPHAHLEECPDIIVNRIAADAGSKRMEEDSRIKRTRDNMVSLKVENSGTQPMSGKAAIYVAEVCESRHIPAAGTWTLIGEIPLPKIPAKNSSIVGPITWPGAKVPKPGDYYLVATIDDGTPGKERIAGIYTGGVKVKRIRIDR